MPDKKSQEIGKKIYSYRSIAGLTQAALAKKAKVSPNTVARLERGEHRASSLTIEKLARALDVAVSDIH